MESTLEFKNELEEYLLRARWWPWKNTRQEVNILVYDHVDRLHYLLIESNGLVFQLPLVEVDNVPSSLENRGFCTSGKCYVEAEYTTIFLDLIRKLSKTSYREITTPIEKISVYNSKPLTLESTNTIAVYESNYGKLVLKSYRLLPGVNIEVKILEHLGRLRYRYIPRIHGLLFYEGRATSIIMDYVAGRGDGGTLFYYSLLEYLERNRNAGEIGLASKLGVIIGELHLYLNRESEDSFFGVENTTGRDLSNWEARIEKMYSNGLKRLDEVEASLGETEREELEYWRRKAEEARPIVEEALDLLSKLYKDAVKARIHQDLHLGQMIYTGDGEVDFVITDFEGEPGRTNEERLEKEPVLRDIASMIRSFHYLSHAGIMNALSLTRHKTSLLMMENDPSLEWRIRHVKAMTYSYYARVLKTILMPQEASSPKTIWFYLYPWIVERAVYEFYYESLYRPLWSSIPITGLYEAKIYTKLKI